MEKRLLGNTGIEVSVIGLGGHIFPSEPTEYYDGFYGRRILEEEALAVRRSVVETALSAGINLLAADFDFEASALGRILEELGARNKTIITTVIDFRPAPDQPIQWSELEEGIDCRLSQLRTDRVELPQIRVENRFLEIGLLEELVWRLAGIKDKGKIIAPVFYSSDSDLDVLIAGLEQGLFSVTARALGLLNPMARETLLPYVLTAGAGFLSFVPFQKGWLFDCGAEAGMPATDTVQAGLQWPLAVPGVTAALCGASGSDEVLANVAAVENGSLTWPLDEQIGRLTATKSYDRFIDEIGQHAPHLVHDWRVRSI